MRVSMRACCVYKCMNVCLMCGQMSGWAGRWWVGVGVLASGGGREKCAGRKTGGELVGKEELKFFFILL